MGRKRLSKWHPILFHLTISLGVIILLSSCQGKNPLAIFNRPVYTADYRQLEQIQNCIGQEKYDAALAENTKLERRYHDSVNVNNEYSRVIVISSQMNASMLKKVIQNKKTRSKLLLKIEQHDLIVKKLNSKINKLNSKTNKLSKKIKNMNASLKNIEILKNENKKLRQQINDFKEIDLQADKIKAAS